MWVVYLNYFIHSFSKLMYLFLNEILKIPVYSYYCARAVNIRVPPQFAQMLTFAQIIQVIKPFTNYFVKKK